MKNTALAALLILLATASLAGQVHQARAVGPAAVWTATFEPCPPERAPCPPPREDGVPKGVYLAVGTGVGALAGGAITQAVCNGRKRDAPERKEGCENQRYAVFSGAAVGAFVGFGVTAFFYRLAFESEVYHAAAPAARPVDLVTFRIPVGR